ncbi:MAG: hemerythrin domain-containing protein [Planctomycetes bacterium]|nr:hemerythrin domain-containing protein [Planctomycetota bacterium]
MARPTDELRADHAAVEAGLAVLAGIGAHVRAGGRFPALDTAVVLRFLREFVVGVHFRRENEIVWPAMAMRACNATAAAVGELMRAQDEAHDLIQSLVFFWEPVGELTDDECRGFADTVDALRTAMQHLQTNEEAMFDDCEATVPPDDQLDWRAQFRALETGRTPRTTWERELRRLAQAWTAA